MRAWITTRLAAFAVALCGGTAVSQVSSPPRELPPISSLPTLPERAEETPLPAPKASTPTAIPPSAPSPPVNQPCTPTQALCPPTVAERAGPPHDWWFSAEYIGYVLRPAKIGNPLLIASDSSGATQTLVGDDRVRFGWASGFSLSGGMWLDDRHTFGMELGGFLIGRRSAGTDVVAAPDQTLTRPFTDALTGAPTRFFVASPGFLAGSFQATSSIRLGGADARLVWNHFHNREWTIDLFLGFRYLDLDEDLLLVQRTQAVGSGNVLLNGITYGSDTALTITDRFQTRNQFFGGEVGARAEWRYGPAFIAATPSVGFGSVHQSVTATGSSSVPGIVVPGGLYAVTGGNAGRTTTNRFAVMTELRAEVGLYLTGSTRLSIGYNFLYLGSVARPADQIDYVVNTRLVPTTRRFGSLSGVMSPLPTSDRTDFWAQGLRVGLEYRY